MKQPNSSDFNTLVLHTISDILRCLRNPNIEKELMTVFNEFLRTAKLSSLSIYIPSPNNIFKLTLGNATDAVNMNKLDCFIPLTSDQMGMLTVKSEQELPENSMRILVSVLGDVWVASHKIMDKPEYSRTYLEDRWASFQRLDNLAGTYKEIGHNLNNIFHSVLGLISILSSEINADDPDTEILRKIEDNIQSASEITSGIRSYIRGVDSFEKQILPIANPITNAVNFHKYTSSKRYEFNTNFSDMNLTTLGNAVELNQLFVILLQNAREAMPEGGAIHINVTKIELNESTAKTFPWTAAGEHIQIEITDDGEGIDALILPHITQPFYTTKEAHLGLGLSTALFIARNHNAVVSIANKNGGGVSAKVIIPIAKS